MLYKLATLLFAISFVTCGQHTHKSKDSFKEKVEDGFFSSRDSKHYADDKHNHDFDHEAVLGSHDAAEEFDHLPPEESKRRLLLLAEKMDANSDKFVDKKELTNWVLHSFKMLTEEEAMDEFDDEDVDKDDKVKWEEHTSETYGIYDDTKIFKGLPGESQMYENDMELFKGADLNNDGFLDKSEFPAFSHPEEYEHMHEIVYYQAMQKRDKDNDGFLSFEEFISDTYGSTPVTTTEHYIMEKDRFDNDFDSDGDKKLNKEEVLSWLIPNNVESAKNEADHLIKSSDGNKDRKLSYEEIVDHYDIFVGSEATNFAAGGGICSFLQCSGRIQMQLSLLVREIDKCSVYQTNI